MGAHKTAAKSVLKKQTMPLLYSKSPVAPKSFRAKAKVLLMAWEVLVNLPSDKSPDLFP